MKLGSVLLEGQPILVAQVPGGLLNLSASSEQFHDVGDVLSNEAGLDVVADQLSNERGQLIQESEITWRPPTPHPGKILCLGLNFADHAAETPFARPDYPILFPRFTTSLVGHRGSLVRPKLSKKFDYEGELVVLIGRRVRHVMGEGALSCVAGYSVFNDATLRDFQMKSPQWTVGKNFDATGGYGPYFVSKDELPPGATGLRLTTRLGRELMQDANTSDMLFGVAETIEIVSAAMTLEPGDAIVMGTPAGVGFARKPPVYLQPGDTVTISIDRIGDLVNDVVDEFDA